MSRMRHIIFMQRKRWLTTLLTVILYNITTLMNNYYTEYFEKEQQKIYFDLYQIGLPSDDPVYTLNKVLEELDYSRLLTGYNTKGRKGYNPIMMFAVITYANMARYKSY